MAIDLTKEGSHSFAATVTKVNNQNGWVRVTLESNEDQSITALIKEDNLSKLGTLAAEGVKDTAHISIKPKKDKPGELVIWLDGFGAKPEQRKGGGGYQRPPSYTDTKEGFEAHQALINKRDLVEQRFMCRRSALDHAVALQLAGKIDAWQDEAKKMYLFLTASHEPNQGGAS